MPRLSVIALLLLSLSQPSLVTALEAGVRSLDNDGVKTAAHNPSDQAEAEDDQDSGTAIDEQLKLLADLRIHSAEELERVLLRVDELASDPQRDQDAAPVVFLLHGEEARTLYRDNYHAHRAVVDLAAKLSAFELVDIRVCEVWADNKGLDNQLLQPFVGTVPFAPREKKRLVKEEGFQYF